MVAGDGIKLAPGQPSVTARTHYIGPDDAKAIAERAKALRSGPNPDGDGEPEPERDVLADVRTILGSEARLRSDEVRQQLATRWPESYREWTASDLVQALKPHGAEPRKYQGNQMISTARVDAAVESRSEEADDAGEAERTG